MPIDSSTVALVTGANRGLGQRFTQQLVERGAKVYAAARNPAHLTLPGVIPLQLDATDPASIERAAAQATDVTLLINNAGSSTGADLLRGDLAKIRLEMDTHYFGTLSVIRAFAGHLKANGGGAVLNVLSALSWLSLPTSGAYCAAKSAAWSMTNSLRLQLAEQGTKVTALHVGYMDTDMIAKLDVPKSDPAQIAKQALDGVASGAFEVLADETARKVRAGLSGGLETLYPQLTQQR